MKTSPEQNKIVSNIENNFSEPDEFEYSFNENGYNNFPKGLNANILASIGASCLSGTELYMMYMDDIPAQKSAMDFGPWLVVQFPSMDQESETQQEKVLTGYDVIAVFESSPSVSGTVDDEYLNSIVKKVNN